MNLKIFLGNLPWYKPGFYGVRSGSRWPHFETKVSRYMPFPFQLAYAAAVLEQRGFEVLLVDGIAEGISEDEFISRLLIFEPNLVILEVSTPSFNTDIRFVRKLRKSIGRDVSIALCGPHTPMFQPDFLIANEEVDLIMVREYEKTLLKTALALAKGEDLDSIPGLVFRKSARAPQFTGSPAIFRNIDMLPWPARHFLPMNKYFDNPGNMPEPTLQMWASRGCPYKCSYCIWPHIMNGNGYRPRSINSVLDEMEQVCSEYGFRSVYFDDDTFNIGKERMLEFCNEKIRRKLDIPWAIMARADLMDQEILEIMARAGLHAVKYGVESANPRLLANIRKNLNIKKAIHNIMITKGLGIKVHLTFMFGIPGETKGSIRKTIKLAHKLNPHSLQFSILTPLPGTPIYDELKKRNHLLECKDWSKLDGYFTSVIRTEKLSAEDLEKAVRFAWRSWVLRKMLRIPNKIEINNLIKSIPGYVSNPVGLLKQARRFLHV